MNEFEYAVSYHASFGTGIFSKLLTLNNLRHFVSQASCVRGARRRNAPFHRRSVVILFTIFDVLEKQRIRRFCMIGKEKILEVIRLLESRKISMRQIAQKMELSRGSVSNIAKKIDLLKLKIAESLDFHREGPLRRCPRCGGMTQVPCTYCELKKIIGNGSSKVDWCWDSQKYPPLQIELHGAHLKRYLEVKKWRDRQQDPNFFNIPEDWPWRSQKSRRNPNSRGEPIAMGSQRASARPKKPLPMDADLEKNS